MRRLRRHCDVEPIGQALEVLPRRYREMFEDMPVLMGVDPGFAGLHFHRDASFGRSYASTMHVTYPWHQTHLPVAQRETTIVMPLSKKDDERGYGTWGHVASIVHEIGHVLDERLGFSVDLGPVSDYAATNRYEAFACAFTAWVWGPQTQAGRADPYARLHADGRGIALFESMA